MCAIFGWMVKQANCQGRNKLVKLTDMMSHRGPDSTGYERLTTRDGQYSVGLGHRRLSIIDLSSSGHQPMWSSDKTSCIIFNGEIYNYLELRTELEALGQKFVTNSDTEVLLCAINYWGDRKSVV